MKLDRYCAMIFIVLTTGFIWVRGSKQYNCSVGNNCLVQKENKIINVTEELDQDEFSGANTPLEHAEDSKAVENGSKRNIALTDALKDFLKMVEKAQVGVSPYVKPVNLAVSGAPQAIFPTSPSPIADVTSAASSGGVATSPSATSTPPPVFNQSSTVPTLAPITITSNQSMTNMTIVSPSSLQTGSAILTLGNPVGKPGKNYTIVILNPNFPPVSSASQTVGVAGVPRIAPQAMITGGFPPIGIPHLPGPKPKGQQEAAAPCINKSPHCINWANKRECIKNPAYMMANCRRSCTSCARCENEHNLCTRWAKDGECGKNWKFMEQKCWRSCSNCAPCVDIMLTRCPTWAKNGECRKNGKFMENKCWRSCSSCAKCENKNDHCIEWAAKGLCQSSYPYMSQNCWKSCSFCAPCIDKRPNKCPGWAANGQCKKNREYMEEYCWRSCSQCCKNKNKHCKSWAQNGECTQNPDFMNENCALSCNKC
ncbi:uncharacterized protein [Montipora capricornis]|uniref:uncharacterized protein n=1 Tax=Montipora capricornis TaxID=246305 RepID=UPI0035F12492